MLDARHPALWAVFALENVVRCWESKIFFALAKKEAFTSFTPNAQYQWSDTKSHGKRTQSVSYIVLPYPHYSHHRVEYEVEQIEPDASI